MKTSKRLQLKLKHAELVKAGKYDAARKVLSLLNDGYVTLWCNNLDSLEAADILNKMGIYSISIPKWAVVTYSL